MTKRMKVEQFVRELNAIPNEMVRRALIGEDFEYYDCFVEITTPVIGDYVSYPVTGEVVDVDIENEIAIIDTGYENEEVEFSEIEFEDRGILPMWGTMWIINNIDYKIQDIEFVYKMSELGFRIYDTEFGVIIGIDGAGYDFYENHWTPLYELLGY